jgi:hypothetical protein
MRHLAVAFVLLTPVLRAQPAGANLEHGQVIYARHSCCHGPDTYGGEKGPALANNRGLRRNSFQDPRGIIRNGRAESGMPPFDIPAAEFDAAMDARDGQPLWLIDTSLKWKASPMTFALAAKQYVAISSGPNVMCFGSPE